MERDQIYADGNGRPADTDGPFEFSEAVARVFPDMLRRSIPGYAATIQAIGSLAQRFVQPASRCYDLGCSLGAATLAMRHGISATGCRIIAVDNATAMVNRCRDIVAKDEGSVPVEVVYGDAEDMRLQNASMIVMNYTLQFLPAEKRQAMIDRIAAGMLSGGVFVLSEKVVHEDPVVEATLAQLHYEFKRRHNYSELEISRKRAALENVLVPETVKQHSDRLRSAGFTHVSIWLQYFNFVSMLAIK